MFKNELSDASSDDNQDAFSGEFGENFEEHKTDEY
jgi:hypothetical protein